jgi:uncharacterized protein (TIGR02444 family)
MMRRHGNAFWRFSLRVYRVQAFRAAALALQDRAGADTNLMLWCCWLADGGRAPDRRTLRRAQAAVARWQSQVIVPLRRARTALKAAPEGLPDGWPERLRRRIAAIELDMEFAEQCRLFEIAQALAPARRPLPPREAARASLARYLDLLGVAATVAEARRVDAMIHACWPCASAAGRTITP